MNQLSDTESEQDQSTPVVDVSIEKPKRKYNKKAKDTFNVAKQKAEDVPMPEPPEEPEKEPEPEQPSPVKPKRQMSEKQLQALADAREKRKAAKQVKDTFEKGVAKPEPVVEESKVEEPKAEPKKRGRPKKVDTDVKETKPKAEKKTEKKVEVVKEVHHHYHEPKTPKMKATKHEQAGLKPAVPEILFV